MADGVAAGSNSIGVYVGQLVTNNQLIYFYIFIFLSVSIIVYRGPSPSTNRLWVRSRITDQNGDDITCLLRLSVGLRIYHRCGLNRLSAVELRGIDRS